MVGEDVMYNRKFNNSVKPKYDGSMHPLRPPDAQLHEECVAPKRAVLPPSISIKAVLNRIPIADIGAIPHKDAHNALNQVNKLSKGFKL